MPGAWEFRKSVFVAILTREVLTASWAFALKQLIIPPGGNIRWSSGAPFDHARNELCRSALREGYDYVFFLDDDVLAPPYAIVNLMARNLPIISGMYFRRNPPHAPVAQIVNKDGMPRWLDEFKIGELVEVCHVGAGCLLIQRNVFDKIGYPWFEWLCDRYDLPVPQRTSEDFTFCRKAKDAGYKIIVDTSVQCIHAGLSASSIEGMKALGIG